MPITLLYHDVVSPDEADASGFPGGDAARYKIAPAEFRRHGDAIREAVAAPPALATDLLRPGVSPAWLITFDDGGASALSPTADILEERGGRGNFFVTTDYIGSAGFLGRAQVRELHRRGHLVGSHSCSHPPRMSACTPDRLADEWRRSREVLSELLGEPVLAASVPGGYYSLAVAWAASRAGYQVLFTSEPTARLRVVGGCLVVGRYTFYRGMSAERMAALASGRTLPRLGQTLLWNAKKVAKTAGGDLYVSLRKRLLARADEKSY